MSWTFNKYYLISELKLMFIDAKSVIATEIMTNAFKND